MESDPDVKRLVPRPGDSFVLLASDGLWDVMSDQEAVERVHAVLQVRGAGLSKGAGGACRQSVKRKQVGLLCVSAAHHRTPTASPLTPHPAPPHCSLVPCR